MKYVKIEFHFYINSLISFEANNSLFRHRNSSQSILELDSEKENKRISNIPLSCTYDLELVRDFHRPNKNK